MTGEIREYDVVRVMSRPGKRHRHAVVWCLDALSRANANLRSRGIEGLIGLSFLRQF